jgi:hypothetical protein
MAASAAVTVASSSSIVRNANWGVSSTQLVVQLQLLGQLLAGTDCISAAAWHAGCGTRSTVSQTNTWSILDSNSRDIQNAADDLAAA